MKADIRLDGERVVLEGDITHLTTHDLILDRPERRANTQGYRRALVHNTGDVLTINYAGDYPGGVSVQGNVKADSIEVKKLTSGSLTVEPGKLTAGELKCGKHLLASPSQFAIHIGSSQAETRLAGQRIVLESSDLTVHAAADFRGTVDVRDITLSPVITPANEHDPDYRPYSLFEQIRILKSQIKELRECVADLQSKA